MAFLDQLLHENRVALGSKGRGTQGKEQERDTLKSTGWQAKAGERWRASSKWREKLSRALLSPGAAAEEAPWGVAAQAVGKLHQRGAHCRRRGDPPDRFQLKLGSFFFPSFINLTIFVFFKPKVGSWGSKPNHNAGKGRIAQNHRLWPECSHKRDNLVREAQVKRLKGHQAQGIKFPDRIFLSLLI